MGSGAKSGDAVAGDSLLKEIRTSGVLVILPILFLWCTSLTVMAPIKPSLMTDFFASRTANMAVRCDDFQSNQVPKACLDAHAQVVTWCSWSDFVANSVLSFFMAPVVGRWSDAFGRKLFMLLSLVCSGAQVVAMLLYIRLGTSLFWVFPAMVLVGAFSCISIALAFAADVTPPRHRGAVFGFIMGSFSFGVVVGPMAGGLLSPLTAAWLALGCMAVAIVFTTLFLPESLSPAARRVARRRQVREGATKGPGLVAGLRMLARSALFVKLTICVMISGIVMEGMYNLLAQYFQLKLEYTVQDQSLMLIIAGAAGLFVNTVVLRWLLTAIGETKVLILGLVVSTVQQLAVAFASTKGLSFAAVAAGSLGNMSFPAISSIKSKSVQRHEQGAMQGAIFGARSLATGCGPLLFAALFSVFSRSESTTLPYFPGAPFIGGMVLSLIALAVALTIRSSDVKKSEVEEALAAPLLQGEEDTKASLADLESGIAHPGAQSPAGPKVMDLQTAMSPVSVLPPQQIPGGAGNAGGDGAPPAAGWRLPPRAGGNASGDEDDDEPGSPVVGSPEQLQWRLSNTSVEAAAARRFDAGNPLLLQQQGQQRGAAPGSPRGPPGLARKKSVSFAADDGVRALVRGGGGGGAPDLAPGRRAPAMVPVSPYAQQLPSAYAQQAAPSSSSASRFRWAPEQDDAAAEEEQWHDAEELGEESVLHTRRSVDVRMADTATLHLAAFGARGMETSSAVIRNLMASHDAWTSPEPPAGARQ